MPSASSRSRPPSTSRMGLGGPFDVAVLEERPGLMVLRLTGKGVERLAETEPGGHRWQGPSGKRKQIHTSTVTVAVLPVPEKPEVRLNMKEVRLDTYRATGAGGQHKNKTDSAVRATHVPTGLVARSESERSQRVNREQALAALAAKLQQTAAQAATGAREATRRAQLGSGMRGDKIRTCREQDDQVTDHRSGRRTKLKSYLKGDLDWLN